MGDIIDHESRLAPLAPPRGIVSATTLASTFSTTSTSFIDVTGFSITFTAVAGRQYKISALVATSNSGANVNQFYIVKGVTAISEGYSNGVEVTSTQIYAVDTPGAGSVTYKMQVKAAAGTVLMYGTSTRASLASRMIVEDIGAA